MQQWVWSAQTGIILGAITFFLAFIPILIWQYRSYGRWSALRMLGAAATAIYTVAVVTYTWMPLPPRTVEWCALNGIDTINLTPFAFMDDVRQVVAEVGRRRALRSVIVLQVVFNVVLFVPWGIIGRRFFNRGFIFTVFSGFVASVFVEVSQATGLWGFYDCAYRWADIDDVIMNTAGAFGGAIIAPMVLFWMPRGDKLAASRMDPRKITNWRRYGSMLITGGAVGAFTVGGIVSIRIGLILLDRPIHGRLADSLGVLVAFAAVGLLVYLPALMGRGNVGMQIVWLAPRWRDADGQLTAIGSVPARLARASVFGIPFLATVISPRNEYTLIFTCVIGISVLMVPFTRTRRSFSGVLTGAYLIDTRGDETSG